MEIVKDLLLILLSVFLFMKCIFLQKQLFRQKEYFIKTLCHDFKVSTLAQINGLNIFEQLNNSINGKELLCDIKKACEYSLDLINMLQYIYRFENGEKILSCKKINLFCLINNCTNHLMSIEKNKNISFCIENTVNNILITADEYFINKLLHNLFTTSLNYALNNSSININSSYKDKSVIIEINYLGNPLTHEEHSRMFSINPRFSPVGHGIQLFFCKKIVELHHGRLDYKCNKNGINSFTIILPNHISSQSLVSPMYNSIRAYGQL